MAMNKKTINSNYLYKKYKKVLEKAIELGKNGKLIITPEKLWLGATNRCNLRCIMCFFKKEDTFISLNDFKLYLKKNKEKNILYYGKAKSIDLTAGESFLNPEIYQISKYLKSILPKSEISIITNGTIPIKGNIAKSLKYIDRVGISVDGVNQKTFEFIRRGAKFFEVIKNIQDIVEIKHKTKDNLCLLFCAMTINIKELPQFVKLAYFLDIKYLFVQKAEIRKDAEFDISKYDISRLKTKEVQAIIDETKKEVKKLKRYMTLTDIDRTIKKDTKNNNKAMKMCSVIWNTSPWLFKNEFGIYPDVPCCHMPHSQYCTLAGKKHLQNKSLDEIFNSEDYWKIRSEILSGKLRKTACKNCQYYKMTQWTEKELKKLEIIVNQEI